MGYPAIDSTLHVTLAGMAGYPRLSLLGQKYKVNGIAGSWDSKG